MIEKCPQNSHSVPDSAQRTECTLCNQRVKTGNSIHMRVDEGNWDLVCSRCQPLYGLMKLTGAVD